MARTSSEIIWEFGDWLPIPGKCHTCEKGRKLYFDSTQGRSFNGILAQESQNEQSLVKPDKFSLFTSSPRGGKASTEIVQLVYLPEGSINDLRSANVARISEKEKVLLRSKRSTPYYASSLVPEPFELIPAESTITFREVSPRMPMALVAERGKEREAHEQIQLLEAALRAQPSNVDKGELPRVFIAPTNLPPPPGYVKIPLLPSQNNVEQKKILPQTFLTSEFHQELPPGFIQVPLPERISQLSHSIPFVDPKKNPVLQSHAKPQDHLLDHDTHNRQTQRQQINRGRQRHQNVFPSEQEFITDQGITIDSKPHQHFTIQQPTKQHQLLRQEEIRGDIPIEEFNLNEDFQKSHQDPNLVPIPILRSPQQRVTQNRPRQESIPKSIAGDSANPNSFIEIGSSVINTPDNFNFPTADILNTPDFGNQDFNQNLNDNQAVENPNIISQPKFQTFGRTRGRTQVFTQKPLGETQNRVVDSASFTTPSGAHLFDIDQVTEAPIDVTKSIPFQLSPKPIQTPSNADSPIESNVINLPEKPTRVTPGTTIQLSPKPVVERKERVKIGKPVTPGSQRRRPNGTRRRPNRTRQRLNGQENEASKARQNFIAKDVDTSTKRPTSITTTVNPRGRFNFNRRRRPSSRQQTTAAPETANNVIGPKEETSTLFPPFSVAKKLNTNQVETVETKRKDTPTVRNRFGSRIRSRSRGRANPEDLNNVDANDANEGLAENQEQNVVDPRRQRLRQRGQRRRVRGRNGTPAGKRRRVLNRVRKISDPTDNSLNRDEASKRFGLRASESARVLVSQSPVNRVAQTLDLINQEKVSEGEAKQPKENFTPEETVTVSPEENAFTESTTNIFNLLNFDNINLDSNGASTSFSNLNENKPVIESDFNSFQTERNRYVNDTEQFSTFPSLNQSSDEFLPTVVPIEPKSFEHDKINSDSDKINAKNEDISLPFDFLLSSISQSSTTSQADALVAPTLDTHPLTKGEGITDIHKLQNYSKHSVPQSTDVNDDNILPNIFDTFSNVSDTFSPEGDSVLQDNFYDEFNIGEEPSNKETLLGSNTHIIYAMALSEATPIENFSTEIPSSLILDDSKSNFVANKDKFEPKTNTIEVNVVTENTLSLTTDISSTKHTLDLKPKKDSLSTDIELEPISETPDESTTVLYPRINKIYLHETKITTEVPFDFNISTTEISSNDVETTTETYESNSEYHAFVTTTESSFMTDMHTENSTLSLPLKVNHSNFISGTDSKAETLIKSETPWTFATTTNEPTLTTSTSLDDSNEHTLTPYIPLDDDSNKPNFTTPISLDVDSNEPTLSPYIPLDDDSNKPNLTIPIPFNGDSNEPKSDFSEPTQNTDTRPLNDTITSYLDSFFSSDRKSKDTKNEFVEPGQKVIGHSTVTEVRSSAPMICINGSCVIGTDIRRKRNS